MKILQALLWTCATALTMATCVPAQGIINTVAGGVSFPASLNGGTATSAQLLNVAEGAVDSSGHCYASTADSQVVVRISPGGVLTILAGKPGILGFPSTGIPATLAYLNQPTSIALDRQGNLVIALNNAVQRVTPSGIISTIAGSFPSLGSLNDGIPATSARVLRPQGVAVDATGNIYFADSGNNRIRRVNPAGIIDTVVGSVQAGFSGDGGPALSAGLFNPQDVTFDNAGNLYIADGSNHRIRKVTPDGIISTVAGNGHPGFSGDGGPADNAMLYFPNGVTVDSSGNLYIADSHNYRIRRVAYDGTINTVAGAGQPGFSGDGGLAVQATLNQPRKVAVDATGNLYIADSNNGTVRKVDASGIISTIAGSKPDRAIYALLDEPQGLAIDTAGNLFVADRAFVRRATPDGYINVIAGSGASGPTGDGGPALGASVSAQSVALDSGGSLYIAGGNRVRKVMADGTISTVAGTGEAGFAGDGGPAINAKFTLTVDYPSSGGGTVLDAAGNLYIADSGNHRVRKLTPQGTITTIAGTGEYGYSGDGSAATSAQLAYPSGLAIDGAGNLYITDSPMAPDFVEAPYVPYHRIRKLTPEGTISTVAGNGQHGFSGDGGPATNASLCYPKAVTVDASGNLYILDAGNNRVRKVDTHGVISTIAGSNSDPNFSGDGGPATSAELNTSVKDYTKSGGGLIVDPAGNLFISDIFNGRVRKVTTPSPDCVAAVPCVPSSSVVNAASFRRPVPNGAPAPGSIAAIFGSNLAGAAQGATSDPLPNQLLDTTVTINSLPAPLFYVSANQINVQIPFEVLPGTASIEVKRGNQTTTTSVLLAANSPGIFTVNGSGSGQGAVVISATGELAAPSGSGNAMGRPARHGEFISIFSTGLGKVSNQPASGSKASSTLLAETTLTPLVTIGGVPATVTFSGLAPGFVGVYQVNARVPDNAPTGSSVPLLISVNGAVSNTAAIAVQ